MKTGDNCLAQAAAMGDAQAFATLLDRHYDGLFALCFRLTGTRADAEDLTQDICAALPDRLASFRGEARFTTWLWRVAVNAAQDRRRRAATHARHAGQWGDWERNRRDAAAESGAAQDWLVAAMRALPEDLRDTLALVLDDTTQAQTAEILGIPEGTVAWRVSQAKKRLRALHAQEMQP